MNCILFAPLIIKADTATLTDINIDASDTIFDAKNTTNHTINDIKIGYIKSENKPPIITDTPLPPLNFKNTEKLCPNNAPNSPKKAI